jgi:hypothetical protein
VGTTFLQQRLTVRRGLLGQGLALEHPLNQQATVAAYQDCFMLVTVLGLASLGLMLIILRKPKA